MAKRRSPAACAASSFCSMLFAVIVCASAYVFALTDLPGHLAVAYGAFQELRRLPQSDIDNFFSAYETLAKMPPGMPSAADKKAVHDYYGVLHRILTAGVVMEIMLVPPVIDRKQGILANLDLWQRRMTDRLLLKPGDKVLDTGCGRGKIAANVAQWTGAEVFGVNLDETQVEAAQKHAGAIGLSDRLHFHIQDYNDPFAFLEDKSMDAHYCAQACMFVTNRTKFLKESSRVLKKGARFYGLEWTQLPNYDDTNPQHRKLVQEAATILGTSYPHPLSTWEEGLKKNGFRILYLGHPTQANSIELLEDINTVYEPLQFVISSLGRLGMMSPRLVNLFETLRRNWDSLKTMMHMELATPTYEIVAEKL